MANSQDYIHNVLLNCKVLRLKNGNVSKRYGKDLLASLNKKDIGINSDSGRVV